MKNINKRKNTDNKKRSEKLRKNRRVGNQIKEPV